jgi:hypothetical protein
MAVLGRELTRRDVPDGVLMGKRVVPAHARGDP